MPSHHQFVNGNYPVYLNNLIRRSDHYSQNDFHIISNISSHQPLTLWNRIIILLVSDSNAFTYMSIVYHAIFIFALNLTM
jgi:hypothetical protein